jgi:hypothetical protein
MKPRALREQRGEVREKMSEKREVQGRRKAQKKTKGDPAEKKQRRSNPETGVTQRVHSRDDRNRELKTRGKTP